MAHPSYASMSQLEADNAGLTAADMLDEGDEIVTSIIKDVCELDGYTSPDDNPDLLQCTVAELELILRRHICGVE